MSVRSSAVEEMTESALQRMQCARLGHNDTWISWVMKNGFARTRTHTWYTTENCICGRARASFLANTFEELHCERGRLANCR